MVSRSNGLNTNSTRRPIRVASTSKVLPCNDTVAVLVTVRYSDHRNASVRSAAVGIAALRPRRVQLNLPPIQRGLAGLGVGAPVVLGLDPGGEQPVQFQQSAR